MLSLAKLYAGQQAYYEDAVAHGLEDYYLGRGEAPGRWVGRGAERLRLSGVADAKGLDAILNGRDPSSGNRLCGKEPPKIIGYDATFCAPKSVSLLYALGSRRVRADTLAAHEAAVVRSLGVYEGVACRVRRGHGGATVVEGDGFVAIAFQHRSSRCGDPHLHTHVLIAYLAHNEIDGRWSALDARRLFPWAKPIGHLYEAHLRAELSRRLGVEWGPVRNGIADIAAVPRHMLRTFSQRRVEIEEHLEERGRSTARSAQFAAYATRRPKDRDTAPADMFAGWRLRAEELGVSQDTVAGWTGYGGAPERLGPDGGSVSALFERLAGPDGLTARRSTFDRRSVVQAVADSFWEGADVDTVVSLADDFLSSSRVVRLPVAARSGHTLRRRDGTTCPIEADVARFSTPELLALERRVIDQARSRASENSANVPIAFLDRALRDRPHLTLEQRTLVTAITRGSHGVNVVVGAAGPG